MVESISEALSGAWWWGQAWRWPFNTARWAGSAAYLRGWTRAGWSNEQKGRANPAVSASRRHGRVRRVEKVRYQGACLARRVGRILQRAVNRRKPNASTWM
jgi:hypothetical protein